MSRRSYAQFCGLAHALDVVGERWTLLIVRELATGPKRYTDLADALAGIGTSLLATRVRQLEADGIIQRRLATDQPGSAVVYELSPAGRELAAAVVPLALWGARHQMADADPEHEAMRAEWLLSFLAAYVRRDGPHDLDAVFEFHIDDSIASLRINTGTTSVRPGPSPTPADATLRTTAKVTAEILGRHTTVDEAIADGRIEVTGDAAMVATLLDVIAKELAAPSLA